MRPSAPRLRISVAIGWSPSRFGESDRLSLPQHHDHQERMVGLVEPKMRLEAVEPLDEIEAAGEPGGGLQLLRKNHARSVTLTVDVPRAVLVDFQLHVLEEGLGHRVQVLERLEGRA